MTYNKEYTLHNGKKIYVQYDNHNICQVTKECMEMLLDLHWQGRTEAKEDTNLKNTIREIHDNVAQEMYCKGVDDLFNEISTYRMYDEYCNVIDLLEIAKQLKENK